MVLHHQNVLEHQQLLHKASEAEGQIDADGLPIKVALSLRNSALPMELTNLDRLMEAVTPFIQARFFDEENADGHFTSVTQMKSHAFFYLEDLWKSFKEWSAYGAGVPFLLNGKVSIEQYYVPLLSGIQLYPDPSSNLWLKNSARSKGSSPGIPYFEFMEYEPPYNRRPLTEKMSLLASGNPELGKFRSCDLLPTSWFSVAWYPIYRIPVGPMLKNLDASFLTFHSLSTQSSSSCSPIYHAANTRVVRGLADPTARISVPVFALASYKLKGSILNPRGPYECEQENSLSVAAENWLRFSQVILPDHRFFSTHNICHQK